MNPQHNATVTEFAAANAVCSPVEAVTLVIPGRNASATLRQCLEHVTAMLGKDGLQEIIFVDDGSTDDTLEIAAEFAVRVVRGEAKGAAAARNLGWREAQTPLIWFMDADCEADPRAVELLRVHLDEHQDAGGVGGSFTNTREHSLVACLIHEEIVQRHDQMPNEVNFLASGNVMYRRTILEEVDGFDETCYWAHDADLAFRVRGAGHRLRFERNSLVGHAHPTRLFSYLGKQRMQGFYRVLLYLRHPSRMKGDSYSGLTDHIQPPLAMLVLAAMPLLIWPVLRWIPIVLACLLALAQLPMTIKTVRRTGSIKYLSFGLMSYLRSFYRGIGMTQAVLTEGLRRVLRFGRQQSSSSSANE
ncbi:MAG: glycosyltransferase involved in cell wall biosynthesis [Pirellulaceae bacterium]|jgi:glycosyltransferase involved in cell wall biosynthesis